MVENGLFEHFAPIGAFLIVAWCDPREKTSDSTGSPMSFATRTLELIGFAPDEWHGALPHLLLVLTMITGLVDAVSYLKLGHVFVANMTGNVVFLGFAAAGAPDLSIPASIVAIAAFMSGALGAVGSHRK